MYVSSSHKRAKHNHCRRLAKGGTSEALCLREIVRVSDCNIIWEYDQKQKGENIKRKKLLLQLGFISQTFFISSQASKIPADAVETYSVLPVTMFGQVSTCQTKHVPRAPDPHQKHQISSSVVRFNIYLIFTIVCSTQLSVWTIEHLPLIPW